MPAEVSAAAETQSQIPGIAREPRIFFGRSAFYCSARCFPEARNTENPSGRIDKDPLMATDFDGPAHPRQQMAAPGATNRIVGAGLGLGLLFRFGRFLKHGGIIPQSKCVIPAKAGIQPKVYILGSRFRGNDGIVLFLSLLLADLAFFAAQKATDVILVADHRKGAETGGHHYDVLIAGEPESDAG